ncbi:MAG: ABC transporter permease [Ilumatobacteraceae bacterium]
MWRVALKDLLFRRRRFIASVLATSIAFALALLLAGTMEHLQKESDRIVGLFDADAFLVADGGTGPFSTTRLLPMSTADELLADPAVTAASPFIQAGEVLDDRNVNVLGLAADGTGWPVPASGRLPTAAGEVLVDEELPFGFGDTISLAGQDATIVGTSTGTAYYFGQPTVFARLEDVQQVFLRGQQVATAIAVDGALSAPPPGLAIFSPGDAIRDLERPMKTGTQTIAIISALLWVMAGGVVASMLYLSVTERSTDLATSKAMGVTNRSLFGGLALQGFVLALSACAVGAVLALLLAPVFPLAIEIPISAYVTLVIVGVVVGLVASLIGLRKTTRVDPALAFAS